MNLQKQPNFIPRPRNRDVAAAPRLPFPLLGHFRSAAAKNLIFPERRSAIHGGKLGDILYALPACRALGINHLILNVIDDPQDPLRTFTESAARQIVPLLLAQDYLREVSITRAPVRLENFGHRLDSISYNFDLFRKVPRHLVGRWFENVCPSFLTYRELDMPAHLTEHFAATVGTSVSPSEPWLRASASPLTKDRVVVSITQNWRTYPREYWDALLKGLNQEVVFVGTEKECETAGLPRSEFLACENHLELARAIAGARLFLGTVSFPYAVAEALKVPRGVEICHRNLNAFPTGANGFFLHPDLITARNQVSLWLRSWDRTPYEIVSRKFEASTTVLFTSAARQLRLRFLAPNDRWADALRRGLASLRRLLLKPLKTLTLRTV